MMNDFVTRSALAEFSGPWTSDKWNIIGEEDRGKGVSIIRQTKKKKDRLGRLDSMSEKVAS